MLDEFQLEQPIVYKTLKNSIKRQTITHAYLLELNGYSKGMNFALAMAKLLLCPDHYTNADKCGDCVGCKVVGDNNHLEVKIINPDGQWIKKEQMEELQRQFSKKAVVGGRQIYIINGADRLNGPSANSMLKFLEEPHDGIIAILLVDNAYQVLETIASRCQVLSFKKEQIVLTDTKEKLALAIFNNQEEVEGFVADETTKEKIDILVEYVNFYEKNGLKTIIYKNKEFLECFSDKKLLQVAFSWLILYYKDALNVNLKRKVDFFDEYQESLEATAKKNDRIRIATKLERLVALSETIKFNANANMLMDRLVIELEEA